MKKLINNISQISRLILGLAVGLLLAIPAGAETLTVYTAVEAEDLKRYASAFNEDHRCELKIAFQIWELQSNNSKSSHRPR